MKIRLTATVLIFGFLLWLGLLLSAGASAGSLDTNGLPENGIIPDAETAEKIAEIILKRVYGAANTDMEKPLVATISNDIWLVKGTMPPNLLGGIAELRINKKDGRIISLSHGQ